MRKVLPIPTPTLTDPITRISERMMRVRYLTRSFSFRQISSMTGIPTTTLWRTAHGTSKLPTKYFDNLTTAYYKESYRSLRKMGANVPYARLHRADLANEVLDIERRINRVVGGYTRNAWVTEMARLDILGEKYDPRDLWYKIEEQVRESMRKSIATPDQWYDKCISRSGIL